MKLKKKAFEHSHLLQIVALIIAILEFFWNILLFCFIAIRMDSCDKRVLIEYVNLQLLFCDKQHILIYLLIYL